MNGLDAFYDGQAMRYERQMDADQRYELAAERAGVKLSDKLYRIRCLSERGQCEAMAALVTELLNEKGGFEAFDKFLEDLAQDVKPEPTALVMRWAGEGEYL